MNARLSLTFSCIGHFYFHYFAAMYFTIVIALGVAWDRPFHDLIELWTPAAIMIGLASLPAGRLGDVWSAPGMLIVMFLGMGVATAACSFMPDDVSMMAMLAMIGLFGAIYHPVGISWLIRTSDGKTGKKLAVNGIFGGLGAAAAGALTGILLKFFDWQMAFLLPGVICFLTGLVMLWFVATGRISDRAKAGPVRPEASGEGNMKAFLLLLFPMFAIGLIYNTVQAAMPKLFEEGLVGMLGGNLAAVGGMVGVVYAVGAVMQFAGGHLADRYPLKWVYLVCWALQIPMLVLIALSGEAVLFAAAMAATVLNTGALPSENMMLARFTPSSHHGLAFGVKFVLAFGAAPLGVQLIALVREATGSFEFLLLGLAGLATLAVFAVLPIPDRGERRPAPQPAPAE